MNTIMVRGVKKSKGLFEAEEQAFQKQLEAEAAKWIWICLIILMKKPCRLPAITFCIYRVHLFVR